MLLRTLGLLVVISMAAGMAVACDDDEEPSAEEAREQLCSDLEDLRAAREDLAGLSGDSSVADLQEANDEVQDARARVDESAQDVADAEVEELESALDDLSAAIDNLDEQETITAALEALAPEIDAVDAAWEDVFLTVGCDEAAGSTPTVGSGDPTAAPTVAEETALPPTEPATTSTPPAEDTPTAQITATPDATGTQTAVTPVVSPQQ